MAEQPDTPREEFLEALGKLGEAAETGGLKEAGIAANEVWKSYCEAGFSDRQALYLTAAFFTGSPGVAPPN